MNQTHTDNVIKQKEFIEGLELKLKPLAAFFGIPMQEFIMNKDVQFENDNLAFLNTHVISSQRFDSLEDYNFYNVIKEHENETATTGNNVDEEQYIAADNREDINPDMTLKNTPDSHSIFDRIVDRESCDRIGASGTTLEADPEKLVDASFAYLKAKPENVRLIARYLALVVMRNPEIGMLLGKSLFGQFRFLANVPSPLYNTRSRLARFAGELCKFKVVSQGTVFAFLRVLISKPTSFNIITICLILEGCGKFLYNSPESNHRIKNVMTTLVRFGRTRMFQEDIVNLISSVKEYVENTPITGISTKSHASTQHHILKLILRGENNVLPSYSQYSERLYFFLTRARFDGNNQFNYAISILSKPWKIKYDYIPYVVAVVSKLRKLNEIFVIQLLDNVIENFATYLRFEDKQKVVSSLKMISEFFKFSLINETELINILIILLEVCNHEKNLLQYFSLLMSECSCYVDSDLILQHSFRSFLGIFIPNITIAPESGAFSQQLERHIEAFLHERHHIDFKSRPARNTEQTQVDFSFLLKAEISSSLDERKYESAKSKECLPSINTFISKGERGILTRKKNRPSLTRIVSLL